MNAARKTKADDEAVQVLLHLARHPEDFPNVAFEHAPDGGPVKVEEWQDLAWKDLGRLVRGECPGVQGIAVKSGNGVGKTAFLSITIIGFMLTRYPCKVPCTANSQSQLYDVLWSEIGAWHRCLKPHFRQMLEVKADRIELTADAKNSFAVARTARREQPEALQGFHSPNLLFVVDEASGVDDLIFEVAAGSMSTPGAITLMTGNPTRASGFFFNAFGRMKDRWLRHTVSCFQSTRVSPDYAPNIASQFGITSNVYRVRVLGEFPVADEDVLIPRHLCEAATVRDVSPTGAEIWGVDVARYGGDRSTLAKRKGNCLVEPVKFWRDKDGPQLAALIHAEYALARNKPAEICIDIIGIGASVYDALRHDFDDFTCNIRGVNVAERPAADGKYERLRDELWFKMKDWFSGMGSKIPNQPELIDEISAVRYDFSRTSQKLKIESKDSMRARMEVSPDLAEALLMTFASNVTTAGKGRVSWSARELPVDSRGIY